MLLKTCEHGKTPCNLTNMLMKKQFLKRKFREKKLCVDRMNMEKHKRNSVALCSSGIMFGCALIWFSILFVLCCRWSSTDVLQVSAGTRSGGSRSCPIRPCALRGRFSSERATARLCASLRMGRGDRERARDCDANASLITWGVGPSEAPCVAGTGVRDVELGDVAFETFAGPANVLKSTTAVSGASQSPGWANMSIEESGAQRSSEMQGESRSNRTHPTVVHLDLCMRRAMWSPW